MRLLLIVAVSRRAFVELSLRRIEPSSWKRTFVVKTYLHRRISADKPSLIYPHRRTFINVPSLTNLLWKAVRSSTYLCRFKQRAFLISFSAASKKFRSPENQKGSWRIKTPPNLPNPALRWKPWDWPWYLGRHTEVLTELCRDFPLLRGGTPVVRRRRSLSFHRRPSGTGTNPGLEPEEPGKEFWGEKRQKRGKGHAQIFSDLFSEA